MTLNILLFSFLISVCCFFAVGVVEGVGMDAFKGTAWLQGCYVGFGFGMLFD
jgi:hypothetical protein